MVPVHRNLTILQGKTFDQAIRWETEPIVYKAITGITQAAPCVVTCPGHGMPDGWRAAITSVKGMRQINAANTPPRDSDYRQITYKTADTFELNDVNSADFLAYTSGGYVQYYSPKHISETYAARMSIKDRIGGAELFRLTSENGRIEVNLNFLAGIITSIRLLIPATDTAALTWKHGVYDLELESYRGVVTALLYGTVAVVPEVTT